MRNSIQKKEKGQESFHVIPGDERLCLGNIGSTGLYDPKELKELVESLTKKKFKVDSDSLKDQLYYEWSECSNLSPFNKEKKGVRVSKK